MRFREFKFLVENKLLTEARGLGARIPGEEFVSTTNPNDKIYVQSVDFYPENANSFNSVQELNANLEKIKSAYNTATINVIGKFIENKHRAFGVAVFKRGQEILAFIKPFKQINRDPTLNSWDNQTGIPGYRYNSKTAAKSQAGLLPQDILTKKSNDLTAQEIIDQIANAFGTNSPLVEIAQRVASGQEFPISIPAIPNIEFTAFTNYFCELLHPIALQVGLYTGNAAEAAEKFLGPNGYADGLINFGKDKTEGLSDSKIINNVGQEIKLSSKAGKGAEASTKNLLDSIKELKKVNSTLADKHENTISIIQDIVNFGQYNAPLILGAKYKIIKNSDIKIIQEFKNIGLVDLQNIDLTKLNISEELQTLILNRVTKNPNNTNMYFHSISAVAHKVAEYINENTDFSQSAADILNNGALVQVYTKANEKNNIWTLTEFNTKWPSSTVTGVSFSADKNYMSTNIKGNFTFRILHNNAKDIEDESDEVGQSQILPIDTEIKPPSARAKADKMKDKPGPRTKRK